MKITPDLVAATVASEDYSEVAERQTIVCKLTLHNGTVVVGQAHCLDPAEFDAERGCLAARADAERQIYPLLAFLHREAAYQARQRAQDRADAPRIFVPGA